MNSKTTPKDFFLHIGATIVLYTSAVALINLTFSIINYLRPDQLAGYFYAGSTVWPISMLVILTPILYIIEWLIARDISRMSEKKDLWIRRWRVYLTLFLAGVVVIGDLITLINTYLSGEISSRFVYKVIAVLVIAGAVFAYYLLSKSDGVAVHKMWQKTIAWFGIVLVLAAIIGGFAIVGSPSKQRAIRFDQERVGDLSNIQGQIINHWQTKGVLPATLSDLNDSLGWFTVPTDPENDASYTYTKKAAREFELCATFGQPSQNNAGKGGYGYGGDIGISQPYPYYPMPEGELWDHEDGLTCFDRKIDPERYQVNPKPIPVGL